MFKGSPEYFQVAFPGDLYNYSKLFWCDNQWICWQVQLNNYLTSQTHVLTFVSAYYCCMLICCDGACVQVRTEYLSLLHLVLQNTDYSGHQQDQLSCCLARIGNEPDDTEQDKVIVQEIYKAFPDFLSWDLFTFWSSTKFVVQFSTHLYNM